MMNAVVGAPQAVSVSHEAVFRAATVTHHFVRRGTGVEFAMEAAWVRANLPTGARRVVDLGCGGGGLLPSIGTHRAIGVDAVADGLTLTARRFRDVPLICAVAEHPPFADGSLDAITLQHVVEHLRDVPAAAREWRRALAPGGTLLILTPNAEFIDPTVYNDPTHVEIFDGRRLADILQGTGFEIADLRTLGLPWFRDYQRRSGVWRLRRWVTRHAATLSRMRPWRWQGQTLCCLARKPRT